MTGKETLQAHVEKITMLNQEQFEYFFSHFKQHYFKKGQAVISAGETVDSENFVVSGCLISF
jgi:hypothetical protein